jgi:hypothetical protein
MEKYRFIVQVLLFLVICLYQTVSFLIWGLVARSASDSLYQSASIVTLAAGILLLILFALNTRPDATTLFFLVSGLIQIFWILPLIKRWQFWWYYGAIMVTLISIAVYVEYPIFVLGVASEILQAVFIVICGFIIWKQWIRK